MTKLTEPQAFAAAHEMSARGGGFASAIADAFFRADTGNRALVLHAFAPLFLRHAPAADAASAPHILCWQTKRHYGVFGQRMAALMTSGSRLLFLDLDRDIEGLSTFTTDAPLSTNLVMSCYDSGQYTNATHTYRKEVDYLREQASKVPYDFGFIVI